ncbi:patatin-like phospholipase family protein [Paucibacter sp. PLA-PC-4]|uniref:patatin-like phospholipase family protein n=1 Tax=Paucibacter sp. PLA-PC-4 TaxID=2993655 RepID=UPI00224AFB80|nr:patatin-like phospholipase family protein [Paucibacter sp. PLA-PC-4]MCX2865558.1 patatin-like phospholipase family protein [Paucibacter sp. PLA-PC-4]
MAAPPTTGLILTGGGARAAYQVGVLAALAQLKRDAGAIEGNPFKVIAGTSAGAINAATLACNADDFDGAVDGLTHLWQNLHVEQVYCADSFGVIRTGARWMTMMSLGWALARWKRSRPRSLLDNAPLGALLRRWVRMERLDEMLAAGHMQALAISGSSYTSGQHVTFYQTQLPFEPWLRSQRVAVKTRLSIEHLMASSAIPFIFPAELLDLDGRQEWFGDGSMRQSAPISPAVHLGADRVLVIGAGRMHEPPGARREVLVEGHPSMAQIAGHALSNIFLDALAVDVERLQRINNTLGLLTPEARRATPLRPLDVLVIAPSRRLDDLAAEHQASLPPPIKALLRSVGVAGEGKAASGSALTSYLLFEPSFTGELIMLGMADTLARRSDVQRFFGWPAQAPSVDPAAMRKRRAGFAENLSPA